MLCNGQESNKSKFTIFNWESRCPEKSCIIASYLWWWGVFWIMNGLASWEFLDQIKFVKHTFEERGSRCQSCAQEGHCFFEKSLKNDHFIISYLLFKLLVKKTTTNKAAKKRLFAKKTMQICFQFSWYLNRKVNSGRKTNRIVTQHNPNVNAARLTSTILKNYNC